MTIRPMGAELFHEDGRTDRQTDRQTDMTKLKRPHHIFCRQNYIKVLGYLLHHRNQLLKPVDD